MDKIEKFILRLNKQERLLIIQILDDLRTLKTAQYDVKALKGYKGVFRLRKGKIRIIFMQQKSIGIILNIAYRKDAYRK